MASAPASYSSGVAHQRIPFIPFETYKVNRLRAETFTKYLETQYKAAVCDIVTSCKHLVLLVHAYLPQFYEAHREKTDKFVALLFVLAVVLLTFSV